MQIGAAQPHPDHEGEFAKIKTHRILMQPITYETLLRIMRTKPGSYT